MRRDKAGSETAAAALPTRSMPTPAVGPRTAVLSPGDFSALASAPVLVRGARNPRIQLGAPGHIETKLPQHPIAKGVPAKFDVKQTEMYNEAFTVPEPDQVVFFETWDKGEKFRSGCCWALGQGRVFYFRPGHETYPVFHHRTTRPGGGRRLKKPPRPSR